MRYYFADCVLDTQLYTLARAGTTRRLTPKVFQMLHYLLAHRDRVVSRDELREQVWPDQFISEATLESCIKQTRQALGDSGQAQQLIQTLRGHGYHFVGVVEEQSEVSRGGDATARTASGRARAASAEDPAPTEADLAGAPPEPVAPRSAAVPPGASEAAPGLAGVETERRQLTVLFCDVVDSTTLAGRLDPEEYRARVHAYHQTCAEVIHRFDGYVAQYLGDGVLAYFGYPMAHEDDAQRAVWSGLGILDALTALHTRLALPAADQIAVRLGIHTGLVVVGAVGTGARQEPLALGETPNIAARLQHLAAPNTVVISAATYRLIAGYFTCQPLGEQRLRGVAQPLRLYRVLQASGAQTRLDVVPPRGLTPLVGRDEEVALLHRRWQQATMGQGQVVLLSGEPGIGKSRLVQVLKEHVAAETHTRLEWRGSPYYQQSALYPVIDELQRWLCWHPGDPPAATLRTLEAILAAAGVVLAQAVPLLATLLSLPLPAAYPPLTLTAQRQRQQTLETLRAWLLAETQRQPILFIVEDLHWMDPSTLELLNLLIDQIAPARFCLVLTARPEFHPSWAMVAHLTVLTLRRLTPAQIAGVATHVAGDKTLPPAVLQEVKRMTDGVPLFVEELTKTVLESGLLEEHEDCYTLPGPLSPLAIPATLHDALMARLDQRGPSKAVAQLGATLGRTFAYDVLQAVSPWDETALQHGLRQLVEAELVSQRGVPPQSTYQFKHALIQETAYQSLLKSTRQHYHQRIAQVLQAQFPETAEGQPALLAHHALRGEVWAEALAYYRQAGEKALARSAYHEAVACFEQALAALAQLPEHRDTLEQAINLRLALRSALAPIGDFGRAMVYLHEAESLAMAFDDPRQLSQVSVYLAIHCHFMGAYDQAIATAQRALALATTSEEAVLQALANQSLGFAYYAKGDYRRAAACLGQTVASLDGARRHEHFGYVAPPTIMCCARLAVCHAELGTFAEGRAFGEEGLRIAEVVAHPGSLMMAYYGLGLLLLRHGDLPRALPLLERTVDLCQDADLPGFFPMMAAPLGAAYTLDGRIADAVSLLTQAMEQALAMKRVDHQAPCGLSLGEAQVLVGRLEEAHVLAEHTLALTREHQERGSQAYALHLLGEIAARRNPPEVASAEAHSQQALALAEELGMRPLQAHCHRGLGTLYTTIGQQEQARAELSTAIEMYQAMEMTFWLPQAEAALAQVKEG